MKRNREDFLQLVERGRANYQFLPSGYSDLLVMTETLDEIMADKVISLAATKKYVRNRDIWDLPWLLQQGATLNIDLVKRKVRDRKSTRLNSSHVRISYAVFCLKK